MVQNRNSYTQQQFPIKTNELHEIKKEIKKLDDRVTNAEQELDNLDNELVTECIIVDDLHVNGKTYTGDIESEGVHCACCFKGNYADIENADICCAHIHCACIDSFHFESTSVDNLTVENTLCVCGDSNFSNVNAQNVTANCFCGKATCADIADCATNSNDSTCFAGCTEQEWHDYIASQIPTCAADSAKFAGCTCDEWKTIIKETCVDNAACATNANDSICFNGKDETCWCSIIKGTKVDCAACADSANDSTCFNGCTYSCAKADILSGTANNATCFSGKDEACWCDIIKGTKVDCATCADSATNSTCFDGCTYACAKADILSGTANNATCFDGKTSACWCSIIKGTKVDEASHADSTCDIDNAPVLCASGKCINVTVGTKTSNNFTVPYSTCAELICIDSVSDNANLQIPLVGTQTPYTQLHRDNNSGILFNPGCNTLCVCNVEVKTNLTSCCGTFTCDLCSCGELNINGNANIGGDLSVAGTICCVHTEEIDTSCDNIHLRYDATTAISPGCYSGLVITKYDGTNNLEVGVDCEGTLKIGTDPSNMEAVETRDCSACMEDGYVEKWDAADKKACTKGTSCTHDLCINGNATATGNITATCFCGKATSADNADNATSAGSACYSDKMATHYITGNQDMYPTFTYCYTSQTCQTIATDKDIKYNPSTNVFTVPTVCATSCICGNLKGNVCGDVTGNLTGNADTATDSTCFGGKTEACWCSIIKGTKVDCSACADSATNSTCFNGCTYACAKADILAGCAADSAKFAGCTYACAKADILSGKAACACCADSATTAGSASSSTDSTCFAGKNETCWCNIIKSTCVDNANYATSAGSAGSATTASCVTLNAYDNCGTKSLIVGGTNELGTVGCLTYNTCTCTMYNKGAEFGEYQLTIPDPQGNYKYVLVDLGTCNQPNIKAQSHTVSFNISKSNSSTVITSDAQIDYGIHGFAHLGTGSTPSTCIWLKIYNWRPITMSGQFPMKVVSTCTTDPGCTWTPVTKLAKIDGLVCCACTVCRRATHVNTTCHLALFGGTNSVSCASLWVADTCPLTYNPSTGLFSAYQGNFGGYVITQEIYSKGTTEAAASTCYPMYLHARRFDANKCMTEYAFGFHSNGCMTACCVSATNRITTTLISASDDASIGAGCICNISISAKCKSSGGTASFFDSCICGSNGIYYNNYGVASPIVPNGTNVSKSFTASQIKYFKVADITSNIDGSNIAEFGIKVGINSGLIQNSVVKIVYSDALSGKPSVEIDSDSYLKASLGVISVIIAKTTAWCNASAVWVAVKNYTSAQDVTLRLSPIVKGSGVIYYDFVSETTTAPTGYTFLVPTSGKIIGNNTTIDGALTVGTVCASCFCGNLCGNAATACYSDIAGKLYDYAYTGNCDRNIMITDGPFGCYANHGYSTACPLTFNPATGDLCARAFCGCVHATGEIDCAKCITRMQATTGTCHLAMFSGKTCIADAQAYVSNGCELTYQPATGTLTATAFCGSLSGTAANSTCFNGCTYAQACSDIRSGLISDIGVCVYCGTTCKCSLTKSSSLCLSANAFNANATISTTTYPGACCTGTLTEKCTVFGGVRVVEQGSMAFICASCSFVGCDMYKALCCVVGSNSVMYVNGYMPSLGNVCQLRCLSSTCYSIDGTSQTQQFTSTQTGTVTQRHTMITIMK